MSDFGQFVVTMVLAIAALTGFVLVLGALT